MYAWGNKAIRSHKKSIPMLDIHIHIHIHIRFLAQASSFSKLRRVTVHLPKVIFRPGTRQFGKLQKGA